MTGDDVAGVAGGMGDDAPSAMDSRDKENVEVDAFGVIEAEEDGLIGCICACPSNRECLRA